MDNRIFGERERAMEDTYFRQEDARLLEKLREKASLDEIAVALGRKLQVHEPELLMRIRKLGINLDTAPALFVAPLVQVAWAGGEVKKPEHDAVLRLARERGIVPASQAYAQLQEWLQNRPPDALFDAAVEVIKCGFSVLPPDEKEERIKQLVDWCQDVAEASGSSLSWVLGLVELKNVSYREASTLDTIARTLRRRN